MNAQDPKAVLNMTADTVGKDLLSALVQEIKLLPDVWPKLSKAKQDDVIDRLRARVENNIRMAVHLIASDGRTVVCGDLDQITIKDGVEAVVKFGASAANLHELYEASGKAVLVIVAEVGSHMGGMNDVTGESDQRGLDLGHEYNPNGDGEGMDGEVIDGEATALPSPDDVQPTEEELQAAYEQGYSDAADGKTKNDAPQIRSELVAAWMSGFQAWLDENTDDSDE